MDPLRRLLSILVGLIALALFCAPAVIAFDRGWLALGDGPGSGIERWTLFALVCMAWAVALMFAVVWCNDLLGVRWYAPERTPRPRKRERRRLRAGLRYLEAREHAGRPPRRRGGDGP